jgi:uncharacterized protein (TIGR04141 family)
VYAYGYGEGWRLIPPGLKDRRFGIKFAIRCLDADQIQNLTRHRPGERGRVDDTHIAAAGPVWRFGSVSRHAEIVRRISGKAIKIPTTYGRTSSRKAIVVGAAGLTLRLGLKPADLVADIRVIASIWASPAPIPGLEFADDITAIDDKETKEILDLELDARLGQPDAFQDDEFVPTIPESCLERYFAAVYLGYKFGRQESVADTLDLACILKPVSGLPAGKRIEALRRGRVTMYEDEDCAVQLGREPAANWVEASFRYGGTRYFLIDGEWYEFGQRYLEAVRRQITEILARGSEVTLPLWYRGPQPWDEKTYNNEAAKVGFVNLDRRLVKTRIHWFKGIEICDLLPQDQDNVLVHIKHAEKGSSPLSHLFKQGEVAAMALENEPGAVKALAEAVSERGDGRVLSAGFRPRKVVFGILLKDGVQLTADTLFTFAEIALLDTIDLLNNRGITVDVISIAATNVLPKASYLDAALS